MTLIIMLVIVFVIGSILKFMFGQKAEWIWLGFNEVIFIISAIIDATNGFKEKWFLSFVIVHAFFLMIFSWMYSKHQQEEIDLKREQEAESKLPQENDLSFENPRDCK